MGNSSSSSSSSTNDHHADEDDGVVDTGNHHDSSSFRANQVVYEEEDPFDGVDTLGYRVLGVQPDSPAATAGLVSFLDFLIGVDQQMLLGSGEHLEPGEEYDDIDLPAYLEEHKNQEIEFLVWNIKSQTARLVSLIPNDTWGGAGLLGVTIRLDNYAGAEDRLVRVLSVQSPQSSPAGIAGLVPEHDYILGTTHHTLDSVDSLSRLLYQHLDQILELYVYNTQTDMVRVVALVPTRHWENGNGGILGAEVATGYLHRLPLAARNTAGISVQRKVRYKPTTPSSSQQEQPQQQAVLELEPQLEMEIVSDDDDDEVESVALQEENQKQQPKTPSRTTPPELSSKKLPIASDTTAAMSHNITEFATPQREESRTATNSSDTKQHDADQYYHHDSNQNNNYATPTTMQQHQSSSSSVPAASTFVVPKIEASSSSSAPSTMTIPSPEAVRSPTSKIPQPRTFIPSPRQRKPIPRAPSSAGIDPIEVGAIFERKPLSGEIAGGSPSQIGDLAPQKQPNPYRAQSIGSSSTASISTGGKQHQQQPSIHDHPITNSTTTDHVSAATAATSASSSYASYGTSSYYGAAPQPVPITYSAPPPPPVMTNPSSTYHPSASGSTYGPATAAATTYTTSHYATTAPAHGQFYNPTQPPYPQSTASYSFPYNPPNPAVMYPNPSSSQAPGTLPPPPKQCHYSAST